MDMIPTFVEADVRKEEQTPMAVGSGPEEITAAVIILESKSNEHKHSSLKDSLMKKMNVRLCIAFQSIRNTNNDVNEISYYSDRKKYIFHSLPSAIFSQVIDFQPPGSRLRSIFEHIQV